MAMMLQVPEYRVDFWSGKARQYVLVIPVINEGSRIHNLLHRIQAVPASRLLDIVIIDGGSTDGSLDHDVLKTAGVSGLLTKTGQGKLGAQLRCAYKFAIDNGYPGVVTIDGNDKDDPSTLGDFIHLLDEGYDFVQASRFIKGGEAVRTPLSRLLGIKLVHAPLLSLSSGFRWTDTTQGYRAYSRRVLEDARVSLFRDVFQGYELLFYLSHTVPKLGFRCIETPTRRIYPKGEVPTKISSVRGNLAVFRALLKVVRGGFTPDC